LPPRLYLLEVEYVRAVTATELEWVEGIVAQLRSGELAWTREELMEAAKGFLEQ
jgi:hypothetical protein